MHYKVNDFVIESELAAKPYCQPNKIVLDFIHTLNSNEVVLDYGCGKLRYTIPLSQQVQKVIAIDSIEQLSKRQIIAGSTTTLLEYNIENVTLYPIDTEEWRMYRYDTILCTNVLSAIPFPQERLQVLENARDVLNDSGILFLSVQYRNSYFNSYNKREGIIRYNDGWLIPRTKTKYCFYAPLDANVLSTLCEKVGFYISKVTKHDGSCFVYAVKT